MARRESPRLRARLRQLAEQRALRRVEAQTRVLEAYATAEERRLEEASRPRSWTPFVIGLSAIAVMGVTGIVIYLVRRFVGGGLAGAYPLALPPPTTAPQVFVISTGGAPQQAACAVPVESSTNLGAPSIPRYHDDPFTRRR